MSEYLEVEQGLDLGKHEQEMMNAVHYTMKYIVKDGSDMSTEMVDLGMGVLSGVAQNSSGVPKVSALHMMSIMLAHTGQHGFAAAYVQMVAEEMKRTEFAEQSGIEYG